MIILTDDRYVGNFELNPYNQNVSLEDQIVREALEKLGIQVERKSWSDPHFDWSSTKYILFRTTWDYFDRFTEFSEWLDKVSQLTTLLNSEHLIRWNIDKHYLLDLERVGIHLCETHFIERGSSVTLHHLIDQYNLDTFVIKPCISAGAFHTYKIQKSEVAKYTALFQKLITEHALILQPFQHHIVSQGELSLMVMNGKYTHAVLKKAKKGNFRVQDDYGGTIHNYEATSEEIAFAENVVKSCPEMPLYARVDVFLDNQNKLALAELELIEPELWFRNRPEAADELAKGFQQLIKS